MIDEDDTGSEKAKLLMDRWCVHGLQTATLEKVLEKTLISWSYSSLI